MPILSACIRCIRRYLPGALPVLLLSVFVAISAQLGATPTYGNPEIASSIAMKETLQRQGQLATMVVMFRYKRIKAGYVANKESPRAFYYNSSKSTMEFDCSRRKSRILHTVFFSDRAGLGNIVHQQAARSNWIDENDRRPDLSFFAVACRSNPA